MRRTQQAQRPRAPWTSSTAMTIRAASCKRRRARDARLPGRLSGARSPPPRELQHAERQQGAEAGIDAGATAATAGAGSELDHHEAIVLAGDPYVAAGHPAILGPAELAGAPVVVPDEAGLV